MADDKMKNDDLNPSGTKQAGQGGQGQQPGQQTPGRNPNEEQTGQKGTGNRDLEDDELSQGNRGTNINEPKGRSEQTR
jgi:hypothetical protein